MEFLRSKDVTAKMKISRTTLYHLIQKGIIPKPIQLGNRMSIWMCNEIESIMKAMVSGTNEEALRSIASELERTRESYLSSLSLYR